MRAKPIVYLVTFVTEANLKPDGRPFFPPIGALYIATALRKAGCEPRVLHLLPGHVDQLKKWLDSERPDWIGFSTFTCPTLLPVLEASRHAKKLGIPVVWGGVHATITPETTLADSVDYIVTGEGEETIMELATALKEGADPTGIAGVITATKDGIVRGPPREPLLDLDRFPPAWDFIDLKQYVTPGPQGIWAPFLLGRGCPYRCRFCYNETMTPGRWRRHSDEYVADTLDYFRKKTHFDLVAFNDDYLFGSGRKSTSWIDVLASRGFKWSGCFRSRTLTPEFVRWLEENGCIKVYIGMESGYQETLDFLGKGLKLEDHYNAIEALAQTNIILDGIFVINWPKETRKSMLATLRLMDDVVKMNPRSQVRHMYYIPMPNTPIYEDALEDGFVEPTSTEEWCTVFDHPYRYRGFTQREVAAMMFISIRYYYERSFGLLPMHWLFEPFIRWRWRHGFFKWFALMPMIQWAKSLRGGPKPVSKG